MNAAHGYSKDQLFDLIWLKTGRVPASVRSQGMLVVADFIDGQTGVWHADDLALLAPFAGPASLEWPGGAKWPEVAE